jgi:hypothetical protein
MFGSMLNSVPPAGFEPARAAPEADPVCRSYLPKHTLATLTGGGVWGEERVVN